jgi:hypothetical protein
MPTATATDLATRRAGDLRGVLASRWPAAFGAIAAVNSFVLVAQMPESAQAWTGAWCVLLAAVIYLTRGTARGDLSHGGWPPRCSPSASSDHRRPARQPSSAAPSLPLICPPRRGQPGPDRRRERRRNR